MNSILLILKDGLSLGDEELRVQASQNKVEYFVSKTLSVE